MKKINLYLRLVAYLMGVSLPILIPVAGIAFAWHWFPKTTMGICGAILIGLFAQYLRNNAKYFLKWNE